MERTNNSGGGPGRGIQVREPALHVAQRDCRRSHLHSLERTGILWFESPRECRAEGAVPCRKVIRTSHYLPLCAAPSIRGNRRKKDWSRNSTPSLRNVPLLRDPTSPSGSPCAPIKIGRASCRERV